MSEHYVTCPYCGDKLDSGPVVEQRIKPPFVIGDTIWYIVSLLHWPDKHIIHRGPYIVDNIRIMLYAIGPPEYEYAVPNVVEWISSNDVFATEAEAKAAADKLNSEMDKYE